MTGEKQLNLFGDPDPQPDRDSPSETLRDRIPFDANIPIPPQTYQNMDELAVHCQQCDRCELGQTRINAVIGRGNLNADIMIIGEGPGQHEDEQGLPFVGKSGQLLEKILASVKLDSQQDVYIANMVKCVTKDTPILTQQGYKSIGWIVDNRWSGEVLSLTPDRQLTWHKITGWYRSPLGGRPLYRVTYKDSNLGYTATGDHPILTRRGWIPVEELQPQDLVATGIPSGVSQQMQNLETAFCDRISVLSSSLMTSIVGNKTDWKTAIKQPILPPENPTNVYCIDVEETANFVTPAGVVHNCRPPRNRKPHPDEIIACKPYLLEQIRLVDPKIILFTGGTAYQGLTGKKQGITKIRGQWLEWESRQCMAILHPAYLLRNSSREKGQPKWLMWQDIQAVRTKLDQLRAKTT